MLHLVHHFAAKTIEQIAEILAELLGLKEQSRELVPVRVRATEQKRPGFPPRLPRR